MLCCPTACWWRWTVLRCLPRTPERYCRGLRVAWLRKEPTTIRFSNTIEPVFGSFSILPRNLQGLSFGGCRHLSLVDIFRWLLLASTCILCGLFTGLFQFSTVAGFSPLLSLMAPINRRNFEARVVEPIVRSGEPEYVRRKLITVKRGELVSLIEVLKGFWCCGYVSAGNKIRLTHWRYELCQKIKMRLQQYRKVFLPFVLTRSSPRFRTKMEETLQVRILDCLLYTSDADDE